jgi:hypothetical protein
MARPRWYVLVFALVLGFLGLVEPHFLAEGPTDGATVAQAIVMSMLLFHWCKAHASYNSIRPSRGAPLLVALFAPIGIPYFALKGYGFGKGMRLIGLSVLTYLGLGILYGVCFGVSSLVGA